MTLKRVRLSRIKRKGGMMSVVMSPMPPLSVGSQNVLAPVVRQDFAQRNAAKNEAGFKVVP